MGNVISKILDHFKAEDFHLSGHVKVKTFKSQFYENFGLNLRLYHSQKHPVLPEEGDVTLASISKSKVENKDIHIKATMSVGEFEELLSKEFGLIALVYDKENNDNLRIPKDTTLGQASKGHYEPKVYTHDK